VTDMRVRPLGPFRRIIDVVAILGVLGLGVLCCQQVLSIDGAIEIRDSAASPTDAGSDVQDALETVDACGLAVPQGSCASCVSSQCCTQLSACAADPKCAPLETCLLACGSDYACRATCVLQNPVAALIDVPTLDACVATSCHAECGMACGQAGSYTWPDAAQGCQDCIENSPACTPALTCAQSAACEISGHCAYACPTPDCRAACASDGGDDNALVNAAFLAGALCYQPCLIGEDWSCVNHVVWPPATSTTQQVTLTLGDLSTSNSSPVAGVSARACKAGDESCSPPLSTGTSDDAGMVTLPNLVSSFPLGFAGHFELLPPAAYVPSIFYLSFPLSVTDARLSLSLVPQTSFDQAFTDLNITPLAGRGHVWVVVEDCLQLPASKVVVKPDGLTDPSARIVYVANGDPSPAATSTDPSGSVYLLNVPPGTLTLHAIPDATGIESSAATIYVEPGMLSIVWLLPTAIP